MDEPRGTEPRDTPETGSLDFLVERNLPKKGGKRFRSPINFSQLILPMLISAGIAVVLVSQFAADKTRFNTLVGEVQDLQQLVQALAGNLEARLDNLDFVDGKFVAQEFDALERRVAFLEVEVNRLDK